MPYRPKKPCRHPGCAKLTDGRYCEEHISLHPEVTRSAAKRGYDSKWRKESKVYLKFMTCVHRNSRRISKPEDNYSLCFAYRQIQKGFGEQKCT